MNTQSDNLVSGRGDTGKDQQCPNCGKNEIKTSHVEDNFIYGEGPGAAQLVAVVPMRTCQACGFQFLDSEAEDAQHEAVCRHLGVMTPAQILSLRKRLGLTRAAFAQLTRLGEATLARWERGALIQTAAYDQFLYLLHDDRNVQELRDRLNALDRGEFINPASRSPRFLQVHPTAQVLERARNFKLTPAA